jgi:hypothetical protein
MHYSDQGHMEGAMSSFKIRRQFFYSIMLIEENKFVKASPASSRSSINFAKAP